MKRRFQAVVIVALAALSMGGSVAPIEPPRTLEESFAGDLGVGDIAERGFDLSAGRLVEFVVEQLEGDIAIALLGPDGSKLAESDLPGGSWAEERLIALIPAAGLHVLRITARGQSGGNARYALSRWTQDRASTQVEALLKAHRLQQEAAELKSGQTAESLRASVSLLEEAADILAAVDSPAHEGRVLLSLGGCYATQGASVEAEELLRRSITLLEATQDRKSLARALNDYADLLTNRGESAQAEPIYQRALSIARADDDLRIEAQTWNNLGVLYYVEGRQDRSVDALETALRGYTAIGDTSERANTLTNLGVVYRALGRYADALQASDSALELARQVGDDERQVDVLNNRGVLFKAVGDLRAAADAYQTALELVERTGARVVESTVAANLGSLYRMLGQTDRARGYLERALASATEAGSASDESWALQTLGEIAREEGDASAVSYYQRARERSAEAGDRFSTAYSLVGLGRTWLEQEQVHRAVPALEEALAIQQEISDRPGQLTTHRELGRAMAQVGDADRASDHFLTSLRLAQLMGDPYQEASTRARYAKFLAEAGVLSEALNQVSAALRTIEAMRSGIVQPDQRAGLLSRSQQDYVLLVDILAQLEAQEPGQGFADKAFQVAERARARTLIELLTEAQADLERDLVPELAAQRRDLRGRLSGAQRQLTRALRRQEMDLAGIEDLKADIVRLNEERQDLERAMRLADPRWAALEYPDPIDILAARKLLAPGQALVSFLLGEERSFVFVASASSLALEPLPPEAEIMPLIEEMRHWLERPGRRSLGRLKSSAARLYEVVLKPVEAQLLESEHLLIAADGPLHYLPFETLVWDHPSGGVDAYLISNWTVSYVPSASALKVLADRQVTTSTGDRLSLVAFADPEVEGSVPPDLEGAALRGLGERNTWQWQQLAGARREVTAIAGMFEPSKVRLYVGSEASETRFVDEAAVRDARYLHVAAHALVDNTRPSLSALLLATDGKGGRDGLLQTHEVFDLKLRADLVVLSGCETALGRAVRGEGLVGLTRAFLYAGASAVSVSLWPIDDVATARLMAGFYGDLTAGRPAAEALRAAKLRQARQAAGSHPYYWASFVLVGVGS